MKTREAWARHRFGLALIAVIVAVIFSAPLLRSEVFVFRDHTDYFQPLRYYTATNLRSFTLPLWNPYSASGEPWLANPQTAVFYPPAWLFMLFPFAAAYMLFLALHLAILGWGAYLLFSSTATRGAALVGAVAVVLCGPTLSLLDVQNNLASFCWIPLIIWCAAERVGPRIAACVLALSFLAGEPFFAAVGAVVYVIVVRSWRHTIIAGAGAFGLSAIQLLPFVEMLRGSDRSSGLGREQMFSESMAARDWMRIVIPPDVKASGFDPALSQHFIPIVYIGILVVGLAAIGLFSFHRRVVQGWVAFAAAAVLIGSGSHVRLLADAIDALPVMLFRYPSRMVPFAALALAGLAVIGWDRIRPPKRWGDLLLVALLAVDLLPRSALLLRTAHFPTGAVPYSQTIGRPAKIIRVHALPIGDRRDWIAGYLNLYQRRFDASTAAPVVNARYLRLHDAAITGARLNVLDLFGVGYVLSDRVLPPLIPVARSGRVVVNENRSAGPPAALWGDLVVQEPEKALQTVLNAPRLWKLPVWPSPREAMPDRMEMIGSVESVIVDAQQARVLVDAPRDGVVMITQQDAPAWRVYVDGREAQKLLGAGIFRAVRVTRGRHEIVWRYESIVMKIGIAMTLITALILPASRLVKQK